MKKIKNIAVTVSGALMGLAIANAWYHNWNWTIFLMALDADFLILLILYIVVKDKN